MFNIFFLESIFVITIETYLFRARERIPWLRTLGALTEYLISFLAPTLPTYNQHLLLASTGSHNAHVYLTCGHIYTYHIQKLIFTKRNLLVQ